ncbi:MAG: hypothetical protein ACFFG0_03335 [Candidatus Thorarchaeota archaeon]
MKIKQKLDALEKRLQEQKGELALLMLIIVLTLNIVQHTWMNYTEAYTMKLKEENYTKNFLYPQEDRFIDVLNPPFVGMRRIDNGF